MITETQDVGLLRDTKDKFYTKTNISKLCLENYKEIINILEEDLCIEPSAGSGSFLEYIKEFLLNKNFEHTNINIYKNVNMSTSPVIYDLFLAFLAGFFQIGFGFILITIGSQTTPAAVVGVLMLTESVFGPLWAWLFINEQPPVSVLIGGSIIVFSILFQSFFSKNHH